MGILGYSFKFGMIRLFFLKSIFVNMNLQTAKWVLKP